MMILIMGGFSDFVFFPTKKKNRHWSVTNFCPFAIHDRHLQIHDLWKTPINPQRSSSMTMIIHRISQLYTMVTHHSQSSLLTKLSPWGSDVYQIIIHHHYSPLLIHWLSCPQSFPHLGTGNYIPIIYTNWLFCNIRCSIIYPMNIPWDIPSSVIPM